MTSGNGSAANVRLAAALHESDIGYFAAGAMSTPIPGGDVFWLDGLAASPAGCLVRVRDAAPLTKAPEAWARAAGRALRRAGAGGLRVYLNGADKHACVALARLGARPAIEIAVGVEAGPAGNFADATERIEIRPVESEADWAAKVALLASADTPDGKPWPPARFVELERRKAAAGYMRLFLAFSDGVPAGSFGIALHANLVRLKNPIVSLPFRRSGVGRAIVAFARSEASRRDLPMGCYALPDSAGLRLYLSSGLKVVGHQVEWTADLETLNSETERKYGRRRPHDMGRGCLQGAGLRDDQRVSLAE